MKQTAIPANKCMFKVKNRALEQFVKYVQSSPDTRTTSKTNTFIVNFEYNANLVQVFQLLTLKMYLFAGYIFFEAQIKSNKNETFQNKVLGRNQDGLRSSCTDTLTPYLLSFLYKQHISSVGLIFYLPLVSALKMTTNLGYMINLRYIGCPSSVDCFLYDA